MIQAKDIRMENIFKNRNKTCKPLNVIIMKKCKSFLYSVKHTGYKERNNIAPIKLYSWTIWGEDKKPMEQSEEEFDSKEDAEYNCIEHINEYYY